MMVMLERCQSEFTEAVETISNYQVRVVCVCVCVDYNSSSEPA